MSKLGNPGYRPCCNMKSTKIYIVVGFIFKGGRFSISVWRGGGVEFQDARIKGIFIF